MKFTIVAFQHPDVSKSVLYKQNLTLEGLKKAVDDAVALGANLMSIRGFV